VFLCALCASMAGPSLPFLVSWCIACRHATLGCEVTDGHRLSRGPSPHGAHRPTVARPVGRTPGRAQAGGRGGNLEVPNPGTASRGCVQAFGGILVWQKRGLRGEEEGEGPTSAPDARVGGGWGDLQSPQPGGTPSPFGAGRLCLPSTAPRPRAGAVRQERRGRAERAREGVRDAPWHAAPGRGCPPSRA
jgi:hypothetical protein